MHWLAKAFTHNGGWTPAYVMLLRFKNNGWKYLAYWHLALSAVVQPIGSCMYLVIFASCSSLFSHTHSLCVKYYSLLYQRSTCLPIFPGFGAWRHIRNQVPPLQVSSQHRHLSFGLFPFFYFFGSKSVEIRPECFFEAVWKISRFESQS